MNSKKLNLKSPEEIVRLSDLYKSQCRTVFSTTSGKMVIDQLKKVYCDGNLYAEDDRATAYLIGQRDLVLELASHVDSDDDGTGV